MMPDILIRGMEMPVEQPVTLILDPSGRVWLPNIKSSKEYMASELPQHGDLISRDAVLNKIDAYVCGSQDSEFIKNEIIKAMPVIVPAEKGETQ